MLAVLPSNISDFFQLNSLDVKPDKEFQVSG